MNRIPPDCTPKEWAHAVAEVYKLARQENHSIPDNVLDAMRDILLAAPTTVQVQVQAPAFQFTSHVDWVNHAASRFRHAGLSNASHALICLDTAGRVCTIGKHFARARDEGTFPISVHRIEPASRRDGATAPTAAPALEAGTYETDRDERVHPSTILSMARKIVIESQRASVSTVQRKLACSYNVAAGIMGQLEREGVVSAPEEPHGVRRVLVPPGVGAGA